MLTELRRLLMTVLDKEIAESIERVVGDGASDEERLRGKIGMVKGLRRAREIIDQVFKDNVR